MSLALDLMQGAGVAAAVGIRPFLPALATGALAAGDAGVDFDGTDFSFLEQWGFLLAIVVLAVLLDVATRRLGPDRLEGPPIMYVLLLLALAIGGLIAAGTIADHNESDWWLGLVVGLACAAVGFFAARQLFGRVRRRLDAEAAGALPFYAEAVALVAAVVCIFVPPLAIVLVAALAWLLIGNRRRSEQKYAGLRILR